MGNLLRLIAFDLDGTLVNSRRDLSDSANELIVELHGAPLTEEAIGLMIGEGAATLVRRALAAAGLGNPPGALERFREIYDTRLLNHTRPYDGIPEAVRAARQYGRVVVLTNKPARPSERILEGLGLRDLFEEVIGGDGLWPRKPDPASLIGLMARNGTIAEQTLLIGDSAIDHETALRAGVRCCLATYGFGYATFEPNRLTGHEWFAPHASAIPDVLEEFVKVGA